MRVVVTISAVNRGQMSDARAGSVAKMIDRRTVGRRRQRTDERTLADLPKMDGGDEAALHSLVRL
jgi:hypothetical protein